MINGRKVVAFTPYGREITVSLLVNYMLRDHERGIIDEWMLWINTDYGQQADVAYAESLAKKHKWIKLYDRPFHPPLQPKQMNTGTFYRFCDEPDTVYVRFDDDIVYVEPDAIERLVVNRLETDTALVNFPIIINNAISSYFLQSLGKIPREWGQAGMYCMDPVGWADPVFAEKLHNMTLDLIEADEVNTLFMHHNIQLPPSLQYSVSCFAAPGKIYTDIGGDLGRMEEENWHTVKRPSELGLSNIVVANSLVSHFSFYTQRDYLLDNTNILDRYFDIAEAL